MQDGQKYGQGKEGRGKGKGPSRHRGQLKRVQIPLDLVNDDDAQESFADVLYT